MVSSSFYWTHFLELMLKLSGTEGLDVINRETLEFYIKFDRFFWGD